MIRVETNSEHGCYPILPGAGYNITDIYRGVFVTNAGDTIKPSDGKLEITLNALESCHYVANGLSPDGNKEILFRAGFASKMDDPEEGHAGSILIKGIDSISLAESRYYSIQLYGSYSYPVLESTTDPDIDPGVDSDIWGSEPVTPIVDKPNSGQVSGVDWDKKKPDNSDLSLGVIHIVGKKWHPDSIYKVQLASNYVNFFDGQSLGKKIVTKGSEILLGETKYYYVTEADGHATIHETKLPELPAGDDVLRSDIWGINPVSVDTTLDLEKCGRKMGVYWEKGKPIPNGTGNLPDGMIRLIGRYWHKDSIYTVKLTTNNYIPSASMVIGVEKPASLYTPGQNPTWSTYKMSRDVFDHPINIDSICIYYGGIYGIPPHFLKGQMLKEAGPIVFGSDTCFAPSYRYEPFSRDVGQLSSFWLKNPTRYNTLWLVDTARIGQEMGTGKEVPVHSNVCDMPYPRTPKKVWKIIEENSELVNTGSNRAHKVYGSRNSDGTMKFLKSYSAIYYQYQIFLMYALITDRWLCYTKSSAQYSRELMIHWLRDEWEGIGAINMVAQTRLASSYGLLQMMYCTAVERKYPSTNPNISPEDFNITDTNMVYSMKHMKKLLQKGLTSTVEENGNWSHGFEYWFKNYVWYPKWNTDPTYSRIVYRHTQRFLPQNN
jgi:hypothetical protein